MTYMYWQTQRHAYKHGELQRPVKNIQKILCVSVAVAAVVLRVEGYKNITGATDGNPWEKIMA